LSRHLDDIEISLLLNIDGFASAIKSALQIINVFQNKSREALNLPPLKIDFSDIEKLVDENNKLQNSLRQSAAAEKNLESQSKSTDSAIQSLSKSEDVLENKSAAATNQLKAQTATSVTLSKGLESISLRLVALQGLYSILSSSISSFITESNKQEVSNAKLLNGLKNNNEGLESFIRLSNQAAQLQKITVYPDEEIQSAQSMLTTFMKSSEEIEILTPRILDLAAAFDQSSEGGKSLQEVAVMLGKVNEETIGTLRRVGVAFTKEQEEKLKSLSGTKQAIYLSQILDQNFKNMAVTVGSTAAGKMKIFANQIGELKESFGDLIKSALSPVMPHIQSVIEHLKNAPEPIHKLILGLTALGATFVLINSQAGPLPYILISVITLISALPPQTANLTAAFIALSSAIALLSTAFGALNISSGGVLILVGLLAVGLSKLALSAADSSTAVGNLSSEFYQIKSNIDSSNDSLNKLNELQTLNNNVTSLSSDEKSRYNSLISELVQSYPNLISAIDSETGAYSVSSDTIAEVINQEKELQKIRSEQAVIEGINAINKITAEYQSQIEVYDELKKKVDNYNSALSDLNSLLEQGKISKTEYDMSRNVLNNQFAGVKKEFIESSQAVNLLKGKLNEVMLEANRFPEFKEHLDLINQNFLTSDKSAQLLRETLNKINNENALNNLLKSSEELSKNLSNSSSAILKMNTITFAPGIKPGAQGRKGNSGAQSLTSLTDIWDDVLKDVKAAEDKYNLESVKADGSFDKRFKTPFDRAGAILKAIDERFQFETKFNQNLVDRTIILQGLTDEMALLVDEQNKIISGISDSGLTELQIIEKINNLKSKQLSIIQEIQKESDDIIKKQQDALKRNYDAQLEIDKLKIETLENEFDKKRQLAALELKDKLLDVDKLNIDSNLKDSYQKQLKLNFALNIEKINLDEKNEKIKKDISKIKETLGYNIGSAITESLISSFSSAFKSKITSILKDNLFGGEAVSIFQQFFLQIADRLVDILTEKLINSALGFFLQLLLGSASGGASMAIPMFASGGFVPGSGNSDNVPILATPGEFIINKKSASALIENFGSGFLQWINGGNLNHSGRQSATAFGSAFAFSSGGFVPPNLPNTIPNNTINNPSANIKLEVKDTKIKGNDLYISWKRSDSIHSKRKF